MTYTDLEEWEYSDEMHEEYNKHETDDGEYGLTDSERNK